MKINGHVGGKKDDCGHFEKGVQPDDQNHRTSEDLHVRNVSILFQMGSRLVLVNPRKLFSGNPLRVLWIINIKPGPEGEEKDSRERMKIVGVLPAERTLADETSCRISDHRGDTSETSESRDEQRGLFQRGPADSHYSDGCEVCGVG